MVYNDNMNMLSIPWPFYAGGGAIGLVVLLTFYLKNRPLGASGGFDALCALVVKNSYMDHFKDDWRVFFVVGLPIGGFISMASQGRWPFLWNMGYIDGLLAPTSLAKFALFLIGGLFIGFGTRFANGCTSGHAITGISLGGKNSIIATVTFFAVALVTTWILYAVLGEFA